MSKAVIVGWAHSPFGKLEAPEVEDLFAMVGTAALEHAGVGAGDVDLAVVGVLNAGFSKQTFEAGLVSTSVAGLEHTPALRTENACATGSAAIYTAMDFIESGHPDRDGRLSVWAEVNAVEAVEATFSVVFPRKELRLRSQAFASFTEALRSGRG